MYEVSKLIAVFVICIEIYCISCNDEFNWRVNPDLKRNKRIKCYQSDGWESLDDMVNETKSCPPNPNYGAQLCFGFTGYHSLQSTPYWLYPSQFAIFAS